MSGHSNVSERSDTDLVIHTLVLHVVTAIVHDEAAVQVKVKGDEASTVISVHVHAEDLEKVIGKQGRTARALRVIVQAASMKSLHRYSLDISEI